MNLNKQVEEAECTVCRTDANCISFDTTEQGGDNEEYEVSHYICEKCLQEGLDLLGKT